MSETFLLVFKAIAVAVLWFVAGYVFGKRYLKHTVDGQMIIDNTNPEKEVIQLNLETDPDGKDIYILEIRKRN